MQARPDLDLPGPNGILAKANRSISPTSTSSNSPSGFQDMKDAVVQFHKGIPTTFRLQIKNGFRKVV